MLGLDKIFFMGQLMHRIAAYIVLGLTGLLGGGSLVVFTVFLYAGSFCLTDLGLSQKHNLWLDTCLSLLFFIQHSGMVRTPFRRWLTRFISEEFSGAVYAIASGAVLTAVIVFWQEGAPVFSATGVVRWSLRALFCLSILGFIWGGTSLKSFDPCGIRPILDRLRGRIPGKMPFSARGAYLLVRHPLYLFSILMIWSCPDLTTDRLLFNILWTVWIVIGAFLEERDLIAEFGDTYREYRKRVPMLIPCRLHTAREIKNNAP